MKAVKNLALVAFMACVSGSVFADTFYWQVDVDADDAYYTKVDVTAAQLYKTTSTEYPYSDATAVGEAALVVDGKTTSIQMADISSSDSSYSFFVELYNASGATVWTQYATSYSQIMNSGYVSTGGISTPSQLASGGFNGASVPEPTSGLLLLIGGAMLALRRRRQ